jgi:DNA-binding XRE family transcriptional regulator
MSAPNIKLLLLRKQARLTQEKASRKIEINRVTYQKYEGSGVIPTLENAVKIAELYGLTEIKQLKEIFLP